MVISSYVHQVIEGRSSFDGELGFTASLSLVDLVVLRLVAITHGQRVARLALLPAYSIYANKNALQWLNGLVVSALGIPTRGPRFDSRVVLLFHWVATLGKLFTHIASTVSQLQETACTETKREFSAPQWLW